MEQLAFVTPSTEQTSEQDHSWTSNLEDDEIDVVPSPQK